VLTCSTRASAITFFLTAMLVAPLSFLYGAHHLGGSRRQQYAVLVVCALMGVAAGHWSTSARNIWPLLVTAAVSYAAARGTYYVKGG